MTGVPRTDMRQMQMALTDCTVLFGLMSLAIQELACIPDKRTPEMFLALHTRRWDVSELPMKPCNPSQPPCGTRPLGQLMSWRTAHHPPAQRAAGTLIAIYTDATMAEVKSLARRVVYAASIAVASATFACNAIANSCPLSKAEAAEAAIAGIDSWQQLSAAQQRFPHCDVGYVAEGYSASVVRMLVDHWSALPELGIVIAKRPSFERFVLRHLDTTVDAANLERIIQLATTTCPTGQRRLCTRLARSAQRAVVEGGG